jgi:thiol-activated cytolysin
MFKNIAHILMLIAIALGFAGCASDNLGPVTELAPAPPRTEAISNPEVNSYVTGLHYNPSLLLAEQVGEVVPPPQTFPEEVGDDGKAIVICRKVEHHLSGNIDDIMILNPLNGVVWPGALVKVDDDFVRGTPTPIQCRRSPIWLSVDLPGIGGRGVFDVQDPSQGTVQSAIDSALDYWNNHQYREGYVSKSRSKYTSTFVYSAEQLAATLGVSYRSLDGSLATQFQVSSSRENTVGMVLFKQVFYTVTFDPPSHPGSVFSPEVTLDEVRNACSSAEPPAYVSSVDYGRILMLRIESSTETLHTEMEAAMRYMSVGVNASADCQKTLAKSKMTLITIGGNAEVNARAVDATRIQDLNLVIRGKNALYSKNNPGQPIAYTIRFLKDGRLAKMGFSTDYTELICERHPHGWIGFANRANCPAKLMVSWKEGDQAKYQSMNPGIGKSALIQLKGNAHDIHLKAQYQFGFRWHDVFTSQLDAPPNKYYAVIGHPGDIGWHELDNVGN